MKRFLTTVIISAIVGFLGLVTLTNSYATHQEKVTLCHHTQSESNPWVVQEVNANEVQSHLDNGDKYYEGSFGIHTDEAKAWCAGEVTPTVTPTPTITEPTPTGVQECEEDCDEITPTPTLTPTPTEEPTVTPEPRNETGGNTPSGDNNTYTPNTCGGIYPDAPKLQGFTVDGNGFISLSWWGVTADKYSLRYGYSENDLNFGIPYIPSTSTSIQVGGLTPGSHVWAILTAYNGECATDSNEIDPLVH